MRAVRRDRNKEGEEWGTMDPEVEPGSVPEEGGERLHELTSEFLRSDDPDVVGRLYLAHFGNIVRHVENHHQHRGLAEDAVQEAFKGLQTHYQKHNHIPDRPIAFLVTAARQWIIKQRRDVRPQDEIPLDAISSSTIGDVLDGRSPVRQPFEAVASAEMKEIAQDAMSELDAETNRIAGLHREGKTFEEIAQILGMPSDEAVRKRYDRAVRHVQAALGAHFSSFVTAAEPNARRWIRSRKSAEQAIDLLPPPYNKALELLLVKKLTEREIADRLGVTPDEVRRHHERAVELFHTKYQMTEDELLDVLWHGSRHV